MNKNVKQVFVTKMNIIEKQKVREEIILSIQKNILCLDYLENLECKQKDLFNYSKNRNDEIDLEKIKWIKFQIQYNIDMFEKSLKKVGGTLSDVKPFEWK